MKVVRQASPAASASDFVSGGGILGFIDAIQGRKTARPAASPAAGTAATAGAMLLPLALAQFIASFAGSNMNVAISDIADDLQTTVTGVQTAITIFTLTMAA